jgi:hypothetical protein
MKQETKEPLSGFRNRQLVIAVYWGLFALAAAPARATQWSTLFTAQDVRDHLSTPQGREEALQFCRRMNLSKVYLETFRDGYQADTETLKQARDFFRHAGLAVSGAVATTQLGKPSTGWNIDSCYTNAANQERLESIFRYTAGLFDEIIIDDFFFTDCECSECAAARGQESWAQYRSALMLRMSRNRVLRPARQVNPHVRIILKFPQWYDNFQNRGYSVADETALYDRIWVGTELRDPSSAHWGHKQQYEGFFIYRWLRGIAGEKTGGAWFDPFGTDPTFYLDQAYVSVLAGAPEIFLFHYGSLISPQYKSQAGALASQQMILQRLSKLVGNWRGIPAYKPVSSDAGGEPYIFDQVGMLAIPLLPTAHFPSAARIALFAEYSLADREFVPELVQFLQKGGTAILSQGLAHRLNRDPRLPAGAALDLEKGSYIKTQALGGGQVVIFSDALPQLTFVDDQDRVEQPTPALRQALQELRQSVESFTVTSPDAPPRVAVFPLGMRAAVMNFTELPVACHLLGMNGMAMRLHQVFASQGAALGSDGGTLRMPPHSLLIVE